MNFFYLDADPQTNATYHVNDHVGKMAMEACQMLSTAHRLLDGKLSLALAPTGRLKKVWLLDGEGCVFKHIEKDEWGVVYDTGLYGVSHANHPWTVWAIESSTNYSLMWVHAHALYKEYTFRYSRKHKGGKTLNKLIHLPKNITNFGITKMPLCMPETYFRSDTIQSYRECYKHEKSHLHKWTGRDVPHWIAA